QRLLNKGVGGHIRHCIDFYNTFIESIGSRHLNYDIRARDSRVETDPLLAIFELQSIVNRLQSCLDIDGRTELRVILESSSEEHGNVGWSHSSVARELQSLLSHTVHHYALMAIGLRFDGIQLPSDFGVAPSTIS